MLSVPTVMIACLLYTSHPVQTFVLEQNDGVLLDAIRRELGRGGQVYYLHNRVESIERCASMWQQRLPDARIGIVHGKMGQKEICLLYTSRCV